MIDFNSLDKENKEVNPSHEYITDIKEEYFTENTPINPKYNVTKYGANDTRDVENDNENHLNNLNWNKYINQNKLKNLHNNLLYKQKISSNFE